MIPIIIYAVLWLSFAVVHSVLTLPSVKSRLEPVFGNAYRLSYNVFSVLHIAVVFFLGRMVLDDQASILPSSNLIAGLMTALVWGGVLVLAISLRQYDLGRFSGLSQLRQTCAEKEHEPLNTGGMNRWVRHPLYTGAFMYLWGNAQTSFGLWTAVFASFYLIIGSRHEERKLISIYGDDYRRYRSSVPAFFPWKLAQRQRY